MRRANERSLKASLKRMLKYEITQMQIFTQKSFSYLKLYQIQKYLLKKDENEMTGYYNPNEVVVTPQIIISNNSRLIMKLVLAMDIKYNKPGDNVIV